MNDNEKRINFYTVVDLQGRQWVFLERRGRAGEPWFPAMKKSPPKESE